jgi:hypothetical protein
VADVTIDVTAEVASYKRELEKIPQITDKEVRAASVRFGIEMTKAQKTAANAAKKAAGEASSAWEDVGSHILGALSADAIKGAATGLYNYVQGITEARNETLQLAQATGIHQETLAGIAAAAQRAGIAQDQILGGMEDFGEVLFDAANGGGRATDALELLGVQLKNSDGTLRNTDDALREVIGKFQAMESGAEKNAVAQQIWGDAGNRLSAAMGDIPLDAFIESARMSGQVLDEEAVRATREWTVATSELSGVVGGFAARAYDSFAGLVSGPMRDFSLGLVFIGEAIVQLVKITDDWAKVAGLAVTGNTVDAFYALGAAIDETGNVLQNTRNEAWKSAEAFWANREAMDAGAGSADTFAVSMGDLSSAKKRATDSAKALSAEEAKAAKEQADHLRQLKEYSDFYRSMADDILTDEDRIARAFEERIARIADATHRGVITAEQAADAITRAEERKNRDIAEMEAIRTEETQEAMAKWTEIHLDATEKATEAQRQFNEDAKGIMRSYLKSSLTALEMYSQAQLDSAKKELSRAKKSGERLKDERRELLEQLENAEDAHTKFQLQMQLERVNGEIESNKAVQAARKAEMERAANAMKMFAIFQIGIDTAQGIMQAIALGPLAPFGVAAVIAESVVQLAAVRSAPVPEYYRGTSDAPDTSAATLHAGEGVLNAAAMERMGRQVADAANRGAPSQMPISGGGGGGMDILWDGVRVGQVMAKGIRQPGPLREAVHGRRGSRVPVRSPY